MPAGGSGAQRGRGGGHSPPDLQSTPVSHPTGDIRGLEQELHHPGFGFAHIRVGGRDHIASPVQRLRQPLLPVQPGGLLSGITPLQGGAGRGAAAGSRPMDGRAVDIIQDHAARVREDEARLRAKRDAREAAAGGLSGQASTGSQDSTASVDILNLCQQVVSGSESAQTDPYDSVGTSSSEPHQQF